MTCHRIEDSGAYVIGALIPQERQSFEDHLATCEICQREVAELDMLPGLLAQIDPETLAMLTAPAAPVAGGGSGAAAVGGASSVSSGAVAGGLSSLAEAPRERPVTGGAHRAPDDGYGYEPAPVDITPSPAAGSTVDGRGPDGSPLRPPSASPGTGPSSKAAMELRNRRRRRRRWQAAGAGLIAAGVAVAIMIGVSVLRPTEVRPTLAMSPVATATKVPPVQAEINFEQVTGGTKVVMHCVYTGSSVGKWTYLLVVVPKVGEADQVSSWRAGTGDDIRLSGVTKLTRPEISRVELRGGDGTPLLVYNA